MNARFKKIEEGFFLSDLREEVTGLDHLSEPTPDQGFFKLQQLLDFPFRDGGFSIWIEDLLRVVLRPSLGHTRYFSKLGLSAYKHNTIILLGLCQDSFPGNFAVSSLG